MTGMLSNRTGSFTLVVITVPAEYQVGHPEPSSCPREKHWVHLYTLALAHPHQRLRLWSDPTVRSPPVSQPFCRIGRSSGQRTTRQHLPLSNQSRSNWFLPVRIRQEKMTSSCSASFD